MLSNRTLRLVAALVVFDIATFLISGLPRVRHAHHGVFSVLGEIDWIAFLAGVLALLVTLALWAVRARRQRPIPTR